MENILFTGKTGTGKTYKFFKDFGDKKFISIFPCRQLAYEIFLNYGKKHNASLSTGEVEIKNGKNKIAVYESIRCDSITKDIDVIFIDEFHFLSDKERGAHLFAIIKRAKKLGIQVIGATATNNIGKNVLKKLQFEVLDLKPFFKVPIKKEIRSYEFYENIGSGMSTIIFSKYAPKKKDCLDIGYSEIKKGYLSANASPLHRLNTQIKFLNGEITLLLASNVLAQGVNFPAQQVEIEYNEYDSDEIIEQKLGRLCRYNENMKNEYYYIISDDKKRKINKTQKIEFNKKRKSNSFFLKNSVLIEEQFVPTSLKKYSSFKYSKKFLLENLKNGNFLKEHQKDAKKALNTLLRYEKSVKKFLLDTI